MKLAKAIAVGVAATLLLAGCSSIEPKQKFVDFPLFPEQNVSEPTYNTEDSVDAPSYSYASETAKQSRSISPTVESLDSMPVDYRDNDFVFDVEWPKTNEPAVFKIAYKSDVESLFIAVSETGRAIESIASPSKPGNYVALIGATGSNEKIAGVRVFGSGSWELDVEPISTLEEFSGSMEATGDKAFIINSDRVRANLTSGGAGLKILSYGEQNRVIVSNTAGGKRVEPIAMPGNGTIIVVNYPGDWLIEEAPIVEQTEKK